MFCNVLKLQGVGNLSPPPLAMETVPLKTPSGLMVSGAAIKAAPVVSEREVSVNGRARVSDWTATLAAEIVTEPAPAGTATSSVAVGMPLGDQLPAMFQSLETAPVHVLGCACAAAMDMSVASTAIVDAARRQEQRELRALVMVWAFWLRRGVLVH